MLPGVRWRLFTKPDLRLPCKQFCFPFLGDYSTDSSLVIHDHLWCSVTINKNWLINHACCFFLHMCFCFSNILDIDDPFWSFVTFNHLWSFMIMYDYGNVNIDQRVWCSFNKRETIFFNDYMISLRNINDYPLVI